jgi:hypothetical protein
MANPMAQWARKFEAWVDGLSPRLITTLFLLPFVFAALHQLLWPKPWFTDFYAAACAGNALVHQMPIYPPKPACPDFGTAFIYTPVVAGICAWLQHLLGLRGETALYAVVYGGALLGVLALLLCWPGLKARAPFLAGLTVSGMRPGNLSVLLHAGILFTACRFAARPLLLLPPIALACVLKPTFAVYAALFLFTSGPWWRRFACAITALLPAAGYFIYFRLSDPNLFTAFLVVTRLWGFRLAHGHGFLNLIALAGLTNLAAIYALYAAYAALLLLCGIAIARTIDSRTERLILGIAVCILLYPRLMPYEQLTLPLGMGLLARNTSKTVQHLILALGFACLASGGNAGGQLLYLGSVALLVGRAVVEVTAPSA